MSKKPSYIPLFPDAYHRDTTHLTTEEHGAYLLLLMAAWGAEGCSLPNDEKRLAALAKLPLSRWRKIAPTILEFWTIERGRIWQGRLVRERAYVDRRSAKRKDAADARWASKSNANAYANGMHLGEGEGEGVLAGIANFDGEGGPAREESERTPFDVIRGGRR